MGSLATTASTVLMLQKPRHAVQQLLRQQQLLEMPTASDLLVMVFQLLPAAPREPSQLAWMPQPVLAWVGSAAASACHEVAVRLTDSKLLGLAATQPHLKAVVVARSAGCPCPLAWRECSQAARRASL